jgi:hypothetical protein
VNSGVSAGQFVPAASTDLTNYLFR